MKARCRKSTNNLQRMRELAVQSANATNSASATARRWTRKCSSVWRKSSASPRRPRSTASKVLDGSFGSALFQVGANVGETISIGLQTSR